MALKPKKDKPDKFKKGDQVFWVASINGIRRKYEGTIIAKVNRNQDAQKVARKINKKLHVSVVFDVTARNRSERDSDSYIIETMNTDGESVLHWPISKKLQAAV